MCLSTVWTKKKQKEWLKKQKSPLIVYGVAKLKNGKYYPTCYNQARPYPQKIDAPIRKQKVQATTGKRYLPYSHRFSTLAEAKSWCWYYCEVVLKWRCYKKDITAIGGQWVHGRSKTVIIARKLTLLGEVKPKKKKKSA